MKTLRARIIPIGMIVDYDHRMSIDELHAMEFHRTLKRIIEVYNVNVKMLFAKLRFQMLELKHKSGQLHCIHS